MNNSVHSLLAQLYYPLKISELLYAILALPLTALNFYIIFSTAVLHFNLKLVLGFQSISVVVFALARCVSIVQNLLYPAMENNALWLLIVENTGVTACSWIGLFLAAERIYATLRVKEYERIRSPLFNTAWICLLVGRI